MNISCNLHCSLRDDLSRNFDGIFESLYIDVKSNGIDLILGNIYRFPNSAVPLFVRNLQEILDVILRRPCQLVTMGDFKVFSFS